MSALEQVALFLGALLASALAGGVVWGVLSLVVIAIDPEEP